MKLRLFQFRLRSLLVLITIIAIVAGYFRHLVVELRDEWRREQESVELMISFVGTVKKEHMSTRREWLLRDEEAQYLERVSHAAIFVPDDVEGDELLLRTLTTFEHLRSIEILHFFGDTAARDKPFLDQLHRRFPNVAIIYRWNEP